METTPTLTNPPQHETKTPTNQLQELEKSPALLRMLEEVRNNERVVDGCHDRYDRVHNRHNRG